MHREYVHYLIAFVTSVVFGAVIELIQYYGPRDADLYDLFLDILGSFATLGVYATLDPHLQIFWVRRAVKVRRALRYICILIFILGLCPPILWGVSYIKRARAFPQICSFESYWQNKFLIINWADLKITPPPRDWLTVDGDWVARLTLRPAPYPGLTIYEPYPDWIGYEKLCLSVYSLYDTTLSLAVRIDDIHHDQTAGDRYTHRFRITQGEKRICIPLADVQAAPVHREMDMANIVAVWLFISQPNDTLVLYFDDIHLE